MKKNSIIEISPLERQYENVQQPIDTTSSQTIAKPNVSRRFINIYDGDDCKFISDEDYDSYEAAFEGRDQLSNYVETVELVRHNGG